LRKYLDTSLLVAVLTIEGETDRVQPWLSKQESRNIHVSEWVVAEFSAALSMKVRTRQIDADQRSVALATFARMIAESIKVAPVTALHFRTAARLADRYELGLRAGDALHLAVASDLGAMLCTLDRRQANAGAALGIRTQLV
jgi:uncharacterized protein